MAIKTKNIMETKKIALKIDRKTLPKDGEEITWQTQEDFDNGKWRFGTFNEGDDLFCEGFEDTAKYWNMSWKVLHWQPLNIEWDFIQWIEKGIPEAALKGIDDLGNEYDGTGTWHEGKPIYGVNNIELIKKEVCNYCNKEVPRDCEYAINCEKSKGVAKYLEKELNPEYMNQVFTWAQVKKALLKHTK